MQVDSNPTITNPQSAESLSDNNLLTKAQTLQIVTSDTRVRGRVQRDGSIKLYADGTGDFDNMQDTIDFLNKNWVYFNRSLSNIRTTSFNIELRGIIEVSQIDYLGELRIYSPANKTPAVTDTWSETNHPNSLVVSPSGSNIEAVISPRIKLFNTALYGRFIFLDDLFLQHSSFFRNGEDYISLNISSPFASLITVYAGGGVVANRGMVNADVRMVYNEIATYINNTSSKYLFNVDRAFLSASVVRNSLNATKVCSKTSGTPNNGLAFYSII